MEYPLFGRTVSLGWPQATLVALTLAVVIALVATGVTATAPFGLYNADWTGTSDLRVLADSGDRTVVISQNGSLPADTQPNETVMVVVGVAPRDNGTRRAAQQVVEQGGTLVVADDAGRHSSQLLRTVGASARIRAGPLRDPRAYYRSPELPIAEPTDADRAPNVSAFTLNHAGVVAPNGATVLARTSAFAYIDRNRNNRLDREESLGRRPVLTTEDVGEGRVIVLSDSSVFVNAMLEREGNVALATTLLAGYDTVVLTSYTHALPPLANALLVARRTPLIQTLGLGALVGAFLLATRGLSRETGDGHQHTTASAETSPSLSDRSGPVVEDEKRVTEGFMQLLTDTHPEWDREQLRRVVGAAIDPRLTHTDHDDE